MEISKHPLAEVFGHLVTDFSEQAVDYRRNKLCPFNNKIPNCNKDKAKNPLGVCSIFHNHSPVITCPVRFHENWLIVQDAADFFFPKGAIWSSLTEVRLNDAEGKSAGNIDIVLVAYDEKERIYDFGALEIQAVYISGNVREPFEYYIRNPEMNKEMDWTNQPNYPRPDNLYFQKSLFTKLSSRAGILNSWRKKMVVVLDRQDFLKLPEMEYVSKQEAEVGYFAYELFYDKQFKNFKLSKYNQKFSRFQPFLSSILTPTCGNMDNFMKMIGEKMCRIVVR